MTLTSFPFILFFTVVMIVNFLYAIAYRKSLFKNAAIYNVLLLIESYVFLLISDIKTTICVFLLTIVCTCTASVIKRNREKQKLCKYACVAGVCIGIAQLCFLKYYMFATEIINEIFGVSVEAPFYITILGISFFTFSAVSYLVDTYRNEVENTLLETALYLSFFPKFLSGPIARMSDFKKELEVGIKSVNLENLQIGIQLVVWGMFKKMVLADHLAIFVDDIYLAPSAFSSMTCIWAMLSYSLQIYFDFSGYSDMAIGFSRMLGIKLNKNFDLPYISKNVTEFWKRWHISLSTWLQDYLYISLGGNRKGSFRTKLNLLITMTLGGLWHGASLTFIVWGAIHGLALIVHKQYKLVSQGVKNKTRQVASSVMTFVYITITWVFFRAADLGNAVDMLTQAITFQDGISQIYSWTWLAIVFAIAEVIYSKLKCAGEDRITVKYPILELDSIKNLTLFFILIGMTIILAYVGNTSFIYGKF